MLVVAVVATETLLSYLYIYDLYLCSS